MRFRSSVFPAGMLLLASCLMLFKPCSVQGNDAQAAKAAQMLGRLIGDVVQVKVNGPKNSKTYAGFPPREVLLPGSKRLENLNVYIDVPEHPWLCFAPRKEKNSPYTALEMRRKKPSVELKLLVGRVSKKQQVDNQTLLAKSQARRKRMKNYKVLSDAWQVEVGGLCGVFYEASRTDGKGKRYQESIWVAATDGYTYHLVVSGEAKFKEAIDESMSDFLSRIRKIDRVNVARPTVASLKRRQAKSDSKSDKLAVIASDSQDESRRSGKGAKSIRK